MDKFSFLNATHADFIDSMYQQYLKYPDSLEPSWKAFFQGFDFALENFGEDDSFTEKVGASSLSQQVGVPDDIIKEFKVLNLIEAYRTRGHLFTRTNPVRERRTYLPDLSIENFGLSKSDLETKFNSATETGMPEAATLADIIRHLDQIYCDSIGIEYMHIREVEEKEFIRQWISKNENHPELSADEKIQILSKLNQAVAFENYLHTKFVGQKRFSLEGGESLIPALDQLISRSSKHGVDEVVLGMAHRGRLNVLTNIFGKSYKQIFSEFEGKEFEEDVFSGDVKYHLGSTTKIKTAAGEEVIINLTPNPSHLETVASLVQGISRAKIDHTYGNNFKKVLPIVIHGDAAIAGQGIVYEIAQMMTLDGYKTGGTVHIVVNNQVGFTTNYLDARSSTYCTDIAKVTDSPVMHVNADDVEAVVHAIRFAADYRAAFGKDVYIDLLGYRKYGHNEGDEPRFTQPKLYNTIAKHPNPREIYKVKLEKEGVLSEGVLKKMEEEFKTLLDKDFDASKEIQKNTLDVFMEQVWIKYLDPANKQKVLKAVETQYNAEQLKELAVKMSSLPKDKAFIRKITRLFEQRLKMIEEDKLDWAMAELLAYATLLAEGYNVRISGEDVERGTFSHRHAVVKTEDAEEEYVPLQHINESQQFHIYNSLLSEYAVLGFDYGYAMASPDTLTIWEAQFGDFVNGAQIIVDQYLVAAEEKWKLQNGLVMLLPHGSEGQGAEHSSARLERFLTLCANNNIFVANCTVPANYFHLLRRQMKFPFRKPLVVMTPKSLLRHPKVISSMEELANGSFQPVIDDATADASKVERLVMCSGKVYYDLLAKKEELGDEKVALVRLEQLYPLDSEKIETVLSKYSNRKDFVWVQEEPENMGAWSYILRNFRKYDVQVIAPVPSGTPAPGSHKKYEINQTNVINQTFGI
ncbi:2-oxoglutarate dehydrogenase E1 component [Riemerella anatipestifer]|uniref:2-oxoglutarate dehydrogenase E1 component n=1 Tax=Riemerella anatipestifer TaxID=34085 RepID=UPI0007ED7719|nr:2-oxoglutarate dehydrogenase E1 component [Riemerella anatipestifer]MBT0561551.1 2-oxoglutarate dehydrogenase E1 component [Riemerella anatipestifer]OBP56853.1 2-oxoglutarate dehydrogenase subunit E1 [Riemerella anatipestifer]QZO85669.1 2-oxoglutarate dehydrogenase E1 component [Riemerella anatipestifer]